MYDNIEARVREFIAENFNYRGDVESISVSESLLESGMIDSMGILGLAMFLESEFLITISDTEMLPENLDTINAIVAFVRRKSDMSTSPDKSTLIKVA